MLSWNGLSPHPFGFSYLTYLLYHTLGDLSSIIFNFFKLFLGGVTKGEEKEVVCCSPLVHSYYTTDTGKSQ